MNFKIRYATKLDAKLIVKYIKELAVFEGEIDDVKLNADDLIKNAFEKNGATIIIGEYDDTPVGFALFHETFSTFLGKAGIGLVDLYIEPHMRNKGYGKKMLAFLASETVSKEYGRLEWWVHDWNLKAKDFYEKFGATMVKDIRVFRLDGENLRVLANEK